MGIIPTRPIHVIIITRVPAGEDKNNLKEDHLSNYPKYVLQGPPVEFLAAIAFLTLSPAEIKYSGSQLPTQDGRYSWCHAGV